MAEPGDTCRGGLFLSAEEIGQLLLAHDALGEEEHDDHDDDSTPSPEPTPAPAPQPQPVNDTPEVKGASKPNVKGAYKPNMKGAYKPNVSTSK